MSVEAQIATPGSCCSRSRLGLALVRGIGVGVQEADGDRLDAGGAHGARRLAPALLGERLDLAAGGIEAPAEP